MRSSKRFEVRTDRYERITVFDHREANDGYVLFTLSSETLNGICPSTVPVPTMLASFTAASTPRAPELYYRLRQRDRDGAEEVFGVRVVRMGASAPLLPGANVVRGGERLRVGLAAGETVDLLSADGRSLGRHRLGADGTVLLPALPVGIYVARAADGRAARFSVVQ